MATIKHNIGKFFYFAYGSNLLATRIHILNPSGNFIDIARLENFRLDFVGTSEFWNGAPATIEPTPGAYVWGAIWELSQENLETLDFQEGVTHGKYKRLSIDILSKSGEIFHCYTYRKTAFVNDRVPLSQLPDYRRPSLIYLKTIIKGAIECGLPQEYIRDLKKIKHNGIEDCSALVSDVMSVVRDIVLK